jgi:hypothetical protein
MMVVSNDAIPSSVLAEVAVDANAAALATSSFCFLLRCAGRVDSDCKQQNFSKGVFNFMPSFETLLHMVGHMSEHGSICKQ